jgi:hypothetical protein
MEKAEFVSQARFYDGAQLKKYVEVTSKSAVKLAYSEVGTMFVEFPNGAMVAYPGTVEGKYDEIVNAPSVGSVLQAYLKTGPTFVYLKQKTSVPKQPKKGGK